MPTETQIAANRLNAKKSTGPRTPLGKLKSSRNNLKTGLYSKNPVAKDACEYRAIHAEYSFELEPTTTQQRASMRILAEAEWQNRRYARLKYAVLRGRPEEIPGGGQLQSLDELDRVTAAIANIQESMQAALKWLRAPAFSCPQPSTDSRSNPQSHRRRPPRGYRIDESPGTTAHGRVILS